MAQTPRQLAFLALQAIDKGAFADAAIDKVLRRSTLNRLDRSLTTELVYGCTRRRRTLDALINQLATKPVDQQPPDLRLILRLGLYQLRYLSQIPAPAAVDTTVELTKQHRLGGLSGVVNGVMRQYLRLREQTAEPLRLPADPIAQIGVQYSYPDWLIQVWLEQLGASETEKLCDWLNQPPTIDLRINPLQTSLEEVESVMQAAGVQVRRLPHLPQALRLLDRPGAIDQLPGFEKGWWSVQDSSAQLVGHLLDPQPGETVIDACAAPGGKTTHLAELMGDRGLVQACDLSVPRLKRVQDNLDRLRLTAVQICAEDSRQAKFSDQADRVLLDAPCSGLGTLHRHADARWRQTPQSIAALTQVQTDLLQHTATWVKSGGVLVYATCTLHSAENEAIVQAFLASHPHWQIDAAPAAFSTFAAPAGWLKVLPHHHNMDGFFMVRLRRRA